MIIRKATISDIPQILSIYNYEVLNSSSTFDTRPKSTEDFLKLFDMHSYKYPIYVVEDGTNSIIGYGYLSPFSDKEGYSITVEDSIYIHHLHRGKGIGKMLLKFLIQKAREKGFKNIIAKICAENQPSLNLHKSLGFVEVGKLYSVGYKFNRYLDVIILQLNL
ncbi:GCN5-related N-acetyltransferase [Caldicellulosiruptor saccharolyticus DSM 8903]|uniref:GCN5-related N-acetyltransferase n=1 Tax=Caldicellulosiruptor saccharolyticus (strain ATCC 43494 / DSM 8903 / Tp8T 6331) TaxID=351627 RepID=A4XL16_CALS8|nr:GNAT family N-acetyltransferase [Caldicellulosiruptor saccharolyticus]ABP67601.1 GCN5-related N-acetyltransferase [Caldicellulosiruptor saccharolyticus DSM 8903]